MRRTLSTLALLALSAAFASPSAAQSSRAGVNLHQRSAELSRSYLRTWSASGSAALAQVPRLYAPKVRFYGRLVDRNMLAREKRAFIRRWPVRSYAHRPGTIRVACDTPTSRCTVRSVIDWRTASPARRAVSQGSSRFEQGIAFSESKPAVFHEGGAVITQRARMNRT